MASQQIQAIIGPYVLGETIGHGSFGKVKKGIHKKTGHHVAIKVMNRNRIKDLGVVGKIRREIQNLRLFRHPHIVKLYQVISTPTDIFMVMEFVEGGELFEYIIRSGKLKPNEARRCIQQIISGVDYCHRHMIVHRDLKPENLLVDHHKNVKIADFGLSHMMNDGEFLRTSCGSPNYAAPEVINGGLYVGPEVDIWSCGILLYALLCGTLPFDEPVMSTLYKKIKAGLFPIPPYVDPQAASLIKRMLTVDSAERATVKEIRKDPWFVIDLQGYLFPSANDVDASVVDTDAIREVCEKCEVTEQDVHSALLGGSPQDQLVIAYNIVVDNRRMYEDTAKIPLRDFYSASSLTPSAKMQNSHSSTDDNAISTQIDETPSVPEPIQLVAGRRPPLKRAKWHLGIRSSNKPFEIMTEIYRVLKYLGFEWKESNNYNIHVRKRNAVTGKFMKMGLQLYRVDQTSFLVDFICLDTQDHPDAVRVKRMTRASMSASTDQYHDEDYFDRSSDQVEAERSSICTRSAAEEPQGKQQQQQQRVQDDQSAIVAAISQAQDSKAADAAADSSASKSAAVYQPLQAAGARPAAVVDPTSEAMVDISGGQATHAGIQRDRSGLDRLIADEAKNYQETADQECLTDNICRNTTTEQDAATAEQATATAEQTATKTEQTTATAKHTAEQTAATAEPTTTAERTAVTTEQIAVTVKQAAATSNPISATAEQATIASQAAALACGSPTAAAATEVGMVTPGRSLAAGRVIKSATSPRVQQRAGGSHQIIEFLEMCGSIISTLAKS